ncbi:NAD(P)/FAD-dependent oxidoreductase [Massilia litorea]|uniref:FAD-dependent oxidoreductase n=1 Tax=Massilia litorea TaxID=2769491 RepID=A0A7L9UBA2_9BURK|nr:FAD-dependent oxidoreductase [Massilia litorea]QOL51475.1 FAD-dependent oxidoreductase [Massilia litorea]
MNSHATSDAVIIGGGFYGAAIAAYLAKQRRLPRVQLVENEAGLLQRASYHNQARVHNGYHYPRSFTTALRSRVNLPRFVQDWPRAVKQDFTMLYAIAHRNSKVTARQFVRFCHEIGAKIGPANASLRKLFNERLIEDVFLVEEYAFDSTRLAEWAARELEESGVIVRLRTRATAISNGPDGGLAVILARDGSYETVSCRYVINTCYSGINQFGGEFPGTHTSIKHEISEMGLVQMPPALVEIGMTVMDGPFFSAMPFPARGLHTLSHVRYTPHLSWEDKPGIDPYARLAEYERASRVDRMMRDVGRYVPAIRNARHADSLFEIKTVLVKNEADDGRPILFERYPTLPGCYAVLGAKIDNIYDVFEKLDEEQFQPSLEKT